MYAILVTFRIADDAVATFTDLVRANAAASLADEPGCRRFDVLTDPAAPNDIVLYEIYDDEAAFRAHMQTGHFKAFDAKVGPMVAEKTVRALHLLPSL
ncbi:putative quinol monooxygenase [Acuticoccus sp. I52.16.1]|uniref:putative quinol monooxygenase n=1 Tax=Acuticoccus sp. I52.16.1 TaxID=2928472 RepID=UPI001FD1CCE7|nr:putative quinol monooxygenase [Acuticoccus sp. I52.16.1]UOM35675.1 antibiotic biosynthesis monooxygenase [Acuticoccus sp. I52.16.1]